MNSNISHQKNQPFTFAALNPYIQNNIIQPTETSLHNAPFVEFGDRNLYPNYIYDLYSNGSTLQAIINGCVDYIAGDEIKSNIPQLTQTQATELVRDLAFDLVLYGGSYIQILRNKLGGIAQVSTVDFKRMRTNEDNSNFYYSNDFVSKSYGRCKCQVYPSFEPSQKQPISVFYSKNNRHEIYPRPMWSSAVLSAEIERNIDRYHLNELENGFAPHYIVSFNNGIPSDEIREEIERNFNEKYTGHQNAGRVLINFCDDKDHGVEIETVDCDDFTDKYNALIDRSKEQLFTAFRCNPNLFGISTAQGFNSEEYQSSFQLFQKTVIAPIQAKIQRILDEIFGVADSIQIVPFSISFDNVASNGQRVFDQPNQPTSQKNL